MVSLDRAEGPSQDFAGSDLFDADAGRPSLLLYFGCLAAAAVYYVRVLRKRGWTVTDAAL